MVIAYDPMRAALYTPETLDTVFQSRREYSPVQLAVEGARLAYYRAEESAHQMQRLTSALAAAGFAAPRMFIDNITGAAGFASLRSSTNTALIALRGTQPDDISDIAHDLAAALIETPEFAGRVHAGFAAQTRALLPDIRKWISDNKGNVRSVILTGHSLGAAMATLVASVLTPEWLVTLGSPRVGDKNFLNTVKATNIRRIVDCCDVVTRVPPPVGGYDHLKTRSYITAAGQILSDPAQSVVDTDRQQAREDYIARYAWKLGAVLIRDLADHAPVNYLRAFFDDSDQSAPTT